MIHLFQNKELLSFHTDSDKIKNILAVLIIKTVQADGKCTQEEQKKVLEFFSKEFNLNRDQALELLYKTDGNTQEYVTALTQLEEILNTDSSIKLKIMNYINNIIICDGCTDEEYDVFETIKIYLAK